MENLHTQNGGQECPMQIIKDFNSVFKDVSIVKESMYRIFMGFYVSEDSDYMEKHDREDIAFHFNQVIELVNKIGKFNF